MRFISRLNPSLLLAISVTLLVLGILSIAVLLRLVPDSTSARLDARARISEALTIQLTKAAGSDDLDFINSTLSTIEQRDSEILSIGLRSAGGAMLAETSEHRAMWKDANRTKSTQTHVRVPISNGDEKWGDVEIVYKPIGGSGAIFGMPVELLAFSAFLGLSCLIGVYILLRLALRELDPKRSVPTRVQSAFDSLADGVVIIDEKDKILLVNSSLAGILGGAQSDFVGQGLSSLLWRHWSKEGRAAEFPWATALRENRTVHDMAMNLRSETGTLVNFLVNVSCITDNDDKVTGALVTLKDVSVLERKNRDLSLAYNRLQQSESEIKKQNSQLKYLASHDPLTSCMNRRAFFEAFEEKFDRFQRDPAPITCMMIDIDHFKAVNDTYGHAIGDDVISGLAHLLKRTCGERDIVGRYGGEEFCMVLDGIDTASAVDIAEQLRQNVKHASKAWLKTDRSLSISIGIAPAFAAASTVNEIVDHADKALYQAKETGRDRAILWSPEAEGRMVAATEPVTLTSGSGQTGEEPDATPQAILQSGAAPTHEMFLERLCKSIGQSAREGRSVAVICVSLDSLPQYREAFGDQIASLIIGAIEERLNAIFRASDTVALTSGRECLAAYANPEDNRFLIELTNIEETTSVAWILQRLSEKLSAPLRVSDQEIKLRYSIGASLYPHDGADGNEIVTNAVLAQRKAREIGGDRAFRLFSNDMFELVRQKMEIEHGIRDAIAQNEFEVCFQPIVDLREGSVSGVEVLLRSSSAKLKSASIGAIIEVAESTGMIHELSDYVFRTAFSVMKGWIDAGMKLPLVSVNVSSRQLMDKDIVFALIQHLEAFDIDASAIQLEMTETAMITDIDRTSEVLQTLQSYGFHIALDDFGTGQSSLSHLLRINPDAIKIDKSFIHSLTENHTNRILVTTITDLSRKIGAKVVAEGVETTEQLDLLSRIGCRYVQGFLFSPPLPAQAFKDWFNLFARERGSEAQIGRQDRSVG